MSQTSTRSDENNGAWEGGGDGEVLWAAGDDEGGDDDNLLNIIGGLEQGDGDDEDGSSSTPSSPCASDDNVDGTTTTKVVPTTTAPKECPFEGKPLPKEEGGGSGGDEEVVVYCEPHLCGSELVSHLFHLALPSDHTSTTSTLRDVNDAVLSRLRSPASVVLTYLVSDLIVDRHGVVPVDGGNGGLVQPDPYRIRVEDPHPKQQQNGTSTKSPHMRSVNLMGKRSLKKVQGLLVGERWGPSMNNSASTPSPITSPLTATEEARARSPTSILLRAPWPAAADETGGASMKRRQQQQAADVSTSDDLHPTQLMSLAYCSAFCGLVFDVFVQPDGSLMPARVEEGDDGIRNLDSSPLSQGNSGTNNKMTTGQPITTSQSYNFEDEDNDDEMSPQSATSASGGAAAEPRLVDAEDIMVSPYWHLLLGKRLPEVLFSLLVMQEPRGPHHQKVAAASLLAGILERIGGVFVGASGGAHLRVVLRVLLDLWRRAVELEYTTAINGGEPALARGALHNIAEALFNGVLPHLAQAWVTWSKEVITNTLLHIYTTLSIIPLHHVDVDGSDPTSPKSPPHSPVVGFLAEGNFVGMEHGGIPLSTSLWRTWLAVDAEGAAFARLHSSSTVRWCARRLLEIEGGGADTTSPTATTTTVDSHIRVHLLPTEQSVHRFVEACCAV